MDRIKKKALGRITYSVRGPQGAVSLLIWQTEQEGETAGPVGLHYPTHAPTGLQPEECEFLPGGTCFPDAIYRAGQDLFSDFRSAGRDDEVIYAELENWYRDRMGGQA